LPVLTPGSPARAEVVPVHLKGPQETPEKPQPVRRLPIEGTTGCQSSTFHGRNGLHHSNQADFRRFTPEYGPNTKACRSVLHDRQSNQEEK